MIKQFGIVFVLNNNEHLNYNVMKHIYSKKIEFSIYYTYDDKQKKVYDLQSMKQDFKAWINKMKSK